MGSVGRRCREYCRACSSLKRFLARRAACAGVEPTWERVRLRPAGTSWALPIQHTPQSGTAPYRWLREADHDRWATQGVTGYPRAPSAGTLVRALAVLWTAVGMLVSPRAFGGNQDTFFLGNEAALVGGAITAIARGPDSVWYNPAGVGAAGRSLVDVSAGAYQLRFGGAPSLTKSEGAKGTQTELVSIDLLAAPAALGYARDFGSVDAGFGVFVPVADAGYPRVKVRTVDTTDSEGTEVALDSASRHLEYFVGPAVSFELTPRVRWGASLLALYRTDVTTTTLASRVGDGADGSGSFDITHRSVDSLVVGLGLVTGVEWQIDSRWQFGFVARSPVEHLFSRVLEASIVARGSNASDGDMLKSEYRTQQSFSMRPLAPPRFHVGVARRFQAALLSLETSLQTGLSARAGADATAPVLNGRVGGRLDLGEGVCVGAGVFTDRASQRSGRVDYYGASLATSFGPDGWAQRQTESDPDGARLESVTTIAVSYAVGSGTVSAAVVDTDESGVVGVKAVERRVVAHQIMLHLGSSLML